MIAVDLGLLCGLGANFSCFVFRLVELRLERNQCGVCREPLAENTEAAQAIVEAERLFTGDWRAIMGRGVFVDSDGRMVCDRCWVRKRGLIL